MFLNIANVSFCLHGTVVKRTFHTFEVFSILRTVGIYLSINRKGCIEIKGLKNSGACYLS